MTAMNAPRLFLLLLPALPLRAGTSADYSLEPATLDAGGTGGISADYTADFSLAPGEAGTSAAYSLRAGYAGQLGGNAAGLLLTAVPGVTVNEGGAVALSGSLVLDDTTLLPLPAGDITWSVVSGPVSGISTGGAATAGAVYQDTPALVRGTWQTYSGTLGLTVLNVLPDNFGTYAGDLIPDDWQVRYFGTGNPLAGPAIDADGDGFDNLFEYRAGLDPADPASVFTQRLVTLPGGGHAVIFSPRFPDATYVLMGSSDLLLWTPVTGTVTDNGEERTITDPSGTGDRRYYFLSIQRP